MKHLFPIFERYKELVYLDSAASTLKPKSVIDGIAQFYSYHYANIHRGAYPLSEEATEMYEKARESVARFLGVKPDQVAFLKNATEALNLAVYNLRGREGWTSVMEHHSLYVPMKKYMKKLAVGWKIEKAAVVAITQGSNVLGKVPDMKEAREQSQYLIVDGTQYVQHFRPYLPSFDPDFYAFSGHKIFGPSGVGVLYIKEPERWEPLLYGGGTVEYVGETITFKPNIQKYEAGTPPIAQVWGLKLALDFFLQHEEEIKENDKRLIKYMEKRLEEEKLPAPLGDKRDIPVFSFYWEEVHPHDVATLLGRKHIAVRSGHHCAQPLHRALGIPASFRASLSLYNDEKDVDRFIKELKVIRDGFIR
ncbi:MAG: aminotransferase class V-fold PLP-dependent enzyme [Candidatus Micrarchaeota archaeon]|nr:aminotransferase class V-fold PLP-dependent enzyme [Candidatus Micrarchaeota archaeon]